MRRVSDHAIHVTFLRFDCQSARDPEIESVAVIRKYVHVWTVQCAIHLECCAGHIDPRQELARSASCKLREQVTYIAWLAVQLQDTVWLLALFLQRSRRRHWQSQTLRHDQLVIHD